MAKQKTEKQIDFQSRYGSPQQWAAALGVGLISGYVTFRKLVLDQFHDFMMGQGNIKQRYLTENLDGTLRSTPLRSLEEMISDHTATSRLGQLTEAAKSGFLKIVGKEKSLLRKFEDVVAHREYNVDIQGWRGATVGLFKRLNVPSNSSRFEIWFKSLVAVGVAAGTTLMIFNQLNNRDKLNELDKSSGDNGRKLDAVIKAQSEEEGRAIEVKGLLTQKQPLASKAARLDAERAEPSALETAR